MASITLKSLLATAPVTSPLAKPVEARESLSFFTMPDNKIMDLIYESHVHAHESFDDESLFVVVENILKRTTQVVDKVVQGIRVHVDHIEEKNPKGSFSAPLCTLKQICSEMSCKAPGEEIAHKTTLSILNKLQSYTWEAKAVLTLAAFALEYGDFWLLAQLHHSHDHDQLTKSLEILKKVPAVIRPLELQKRRQTILELNDLIKATLQVIEYIYEFEKLSTYEPKDIPALSVAMDHFPADVYWIILTIVACTTKLNLLSHDDEYQEQDLGSYSQKIQYIINKYKIQLILCKKQIEEADAYRKLRKLMQTPTEIMEILKALIFSKDNVLPQHRLLIFTKDINVQPLIDGSANKTVKIDVLKRKNVLLFISSLDISDEDISILNPIYEGIKGNNQYNIVWMPIVEQWTDELRKKFDVLRSKMPWYSVQFFSRIAGFKFIKEDWHFKGKPMLVVMNPQGKVENPNALHLIRVWGMKAFPFDKTAEESVSRQMNWIGPIVHDFDPVIPTWIKEEKYIFFYGGKDKEWLKRFTEKATTLANDTIFKQTGISIELFRVGKKLDNEDEDDHGILGRFWTAIEGLFMTKAHKEDVDPVSQEIQKLLSYKNESGWFVLSKGSKVVIAGHGLTILTVFEDFDKWKEVVKEKGFEVTIKEYHIKALLTVRQCCRLDILTVAGRVPEIMKCPECTRVMETFVSYKCCHVDGINMNGHH